MTDLLQNASDDQLAMLGCSAALIFSSMVMYFSFYLGRNTRNSQSKLRSVELKVADHGAQRRRSGRAA